MKLIIVLLVLFAAAVFGFSMIQRWSDSQFLNKAERTAGRIDAKQEVVIDQKNQRKELQVTYSYVDATGTAHSTTQKIEYPDLWYGLYEGQEVSVLYRKDTPGQSHLEAVISRRLDVNNSLTPR